MKLKLLILPALFLLSCNSTKTAYRLDKNQPIVDYNHSYDYYNTTMEVNRAIAQQNEQTLILYNGKKIDRKKLNRHLENKRSNRLKT